MIQIRQTETYSNWFDGLRDRAVRARIYARILRLAAGNPGDVKSVGNGISEMRIDCGPGYRVFFTERAKTVVFLLAGGNKSSQARDIATAAKLAKSL